MTPKFSHVESDVNKLILEGECLPIEERIEDYGRGGVGVANNGMASLASGSAEQSRMRPRL